MHRQTLMQNALSAAQETARLGFPATSEALLRVAWELYFCGPAVDGAEGEGPAAGVAEARADPWRGPE